MYENSKLINYLKVRSELGNSWS